MVKNTFFVSMKINKNNDLRKKIIKQTVLATLKKQEMNEKNLKKERNGGKKPFKNNKLRCKNTKN